jgi:hypothetical protein
MFADLAARVLDLLQISIVMLDDVIHISPIVAMPEKA